MSNLDTGLESHKLNHAFGVYPKQKCLIMDAVRACEGMTRKEISRETKLEPGDVAARANEMVSDGSLYAGEQRKCKISSRVVGTLYSAPQGTSTGKWLINMETEPPSMISPCELYKVEQIEKDKQYFLYRSNIQGQQRWNFMCKTASAAEAIACITG